MSEERLSLQNFTDPLNSRLLGQIPKVWKPHTLIIIPLCVYIYVKNKLHIKNDQQNKQRFKKTKNKNKSKLGFIKNFVHNSHVHHLEWLMLAEMPN